MGVPLLLTWLRKRFSACFTPAHSDVDIHHPDNLYIDLNSFLYQAAAIVENQFHSGGSDGSPSATSTEDVEELVIQQLYVLLDDVILDLVRPKALVYLAVDGVSPLGKLAQQRSRRLRHASRNRRQRGPLDHLWDSNCISVGTRFMLRAAQALHHYAVSRTEMVNLQRLRRETAASAISHATTLGHGAEKDPHHDHQHDHLSSSPPPLIPMVPISIVVDDVLRPGEGETKITEAIRRFRTAPQYDPNTSHVICSSDTDVTVTSLLLHDPHIHVLRYEPPAILLHGPPQNRPSHQRRDAWESSFFSIHLFREELRRLLGLALPDGAPMDPTSGLSADFERALHDIVFLLLLFGNDFLPSVSGSIQEGTLDALLQLLAEDFVSRKRYIVDATTNHINFDAARYLLSRLFEIRQEIRQERLTIFGANGPISDGPGGNHRGNHTRPLHIVGNTNWGYEEEPEHQQRMREREKNIQKKCYCYWTMLQWALHYSAGEVQHWGCYYPYSHAPPLDKLAQFCGEVSYSTLRQFAARRAATAAREDVNDDDDDDDDAWMSPTSPLSVASGDEQLDRGQPTDVLVQLLVLLPPQSKNLLPTLLQQSYSEIEKEVNAPMEKIDFHKILAWCESKKKLLSEAERTRFRAYQFFAMQTKLLTGSTALRSSSDGTRDSGEEEKTRSGGVDPHQKIGSGNIALRASDIVFMARWCAEATAEEQRAEQERRLKEAQQAATGPATTASALSKTASSFFGGRRATGGGGGAGGGGIAAAIAAMQEIRHSPAGSVAAVTATADPPQSQLAPTPSAIALPSPPVVLERPSFCFIVGGVELLEEEPLQRALGLIDGNRLVIDHYTTRASPLTSAAANTTLSRHAVTHQLRLHWSLAATVEDPQDDRGPGLLAGVILPAAEDSWREKVKQRARQGECLPSASSAGVFGAGNHSKRLRSDSNDNTDDDNRDEEDKHAHVEPEKNSGDVENATTALSRETTAAQEELREKREALRRRLESLKSSK